MITPIKKALVSGILTSFICISTYAMSLKCQLEDWGVQNTPIPTNTTETYQYSIPTNNGHINVAGFYNHQTGDRGESRTYVPKSENNYDQSINLDAIPTWNNEASYRKDNEPSSIDLQLLTHSTNILTQPVPSQDSGANNYDVYDHLKDSTEEQFRQTIEENQTLRNENINNNESSKPKMFYEKTLHKKTVLSVKSSASLRLDSTVLLKQAETDTYDKYINILSSPVIRARFERVNRMLKKMRLPDSSIAIRKQQHKFLEAALSGYVTKLLKQIKNSDLNTAQAAFNKLKKLWYCKRQYTFLVPNIRTNSGEAEFIITVGTDIMKFAENMLLARPDYIAKHVTSKNARTIIQQHQEQCYVFQQKGDRASLLQERERLYSSLIKNNNNTTTAICLAITEKCLRDPLNTIFHSIIHAPSLERARAELENLELQILTTAEALNLTYNQQIKEWLINTYGFDVLEAADKTYKSRADYVNATENQSFCSNELAVIEHNIEHKSLPQAHAELVHFEEQITEACKENNITNPAEQKEYVIESFGKDALEEAHKKYEERPDHKILVNSFISLDVESKIITILESNKTFASIAEELNNLAECVLSNANLCDLDFIPEIEGQIYNSIDNLRIAPELPTAIFDITVVDHLLSDIQQLSESIVTGEKTVYTRSADLFIRGLKKFINGLDPRTQACNMGHLLKDTAVATYYIVDDAVDVTVHPNFIDQKNFSLKMQACESLISTARFATDLIFGLSYLTPEEYAQRNNTFWKDYASKITAENVVDLTAQILADFVFFKGVPCVFKYLKEIDAATKMEKQMAKIAETFKNAANTHLANNPIAITTEGIVIKLSDKMQKINNNGGGSIIRNSKALLESAYAKIAIELEPEIEAIKKLYDRTKDGFAEFAHRKITMNYKHTLGMELGLSKKGKLTIGGFHHDLSNIIEKSDILKFTNKTFYNHGFYKATIFDGENFVKNITFFPAQWSRDKVISKIYEAYEHFINNGAMSYIEKDNKYVIKGMIKEGIEIEMYITKNGNIVTAYPFLEGL